MPCATLDVSIWHVGFMGQVVSGEYLLYPIGLRPWGMAVELVLYSRKCLGQ